MAFSTTILDTYKYRHALGDAYNWHHTCWQFGTGNIFDTLFRAGGDISKSNWPKVFDVSRPPRIELDAAACMMPFAATFNDIYNEISGACSEAGLNCLRVDEIYNNKSIIDDVIGTIDRARIVICDLTGKNPNVLYETGIAHALGREVIIIAQDISNDVPFDLKHMRCIEYDGTNQAGRHALREKLTRTIKRVCDG